MELIHILDIAGTFAFAVSGAFRAVKYEMDILGIAVLAMATGVGGGMIRDLLLGATPPAALTDTSYILICLAGAAAGFWAAPKIARRWDVLMAWTWRKWRRYHAQQYSPLTRRRWRFVSATG